VVILLIWAVALGFGLVLLAILAFGLYGQVKRLLRAAEQVRADLLPAVEALRPEAAAGRHRA
jgi:hypothetical protein